MLYWPTAQEMLATLPPGEADELLDVIAWAGVYEVGQRHAAELAELAAIWNAEQAAIRNAGDELALRRARRDRRQSQ